MMAKFSFSPSTSLQDFLASLRFLLGWKETALVAFGLAIAISLLTGCSSQGFQKPTNFDSAESTRRVLESYDANGDGKLDEQEQASCPSIESARERFDSNGDGSISAAEITQRFDAYRKMSDFVAATIRVSRGGMSVAGAAVTLTAEPFLGENFPVYTGTTDDSGLVMVAQPNEKMAGIIPTGLYSVSIQAGESATRGCEIADDVATANRLEFKL